MARYFFDIYNTRFSTTDDDGHECADRNAVAEQALRILCDIARDKPLEHRHGQLGAVVRDASDHVVLTANVTLSTTWVGEA